MTASQPISPQRVLIPLGIGTAISLLGDNTLYTVLPDPDIAAQAGVTLTMVGFLLGINRLTRVVLNGPMGLLYDRLPRRNLLLAALFLGALSTALYGFTRGLVPLLVGRVLWGAAWSGIWIGGNTVVLDISDDHNRGRLSGQYQMWFFIGVATASILGGTFTDVFGFRGGLAISAGLTGLAALMWVALLPETRPAGGPSPRRDTRDLPGEGFPWRVTLLSSVPLFAARFLFAGVLAATGILWLGSFLGRETALFGLVIPLATLTGGFNSVRTLASIGGAPLAGWLSDRLRRRWGVVAASVAIGAGGLWLMGGATLVPALLGGLLASVTGGAVQAMVSALIGDGVRLERQSRALSVTFILGDLGSALGPPLALGLLDLLTIGEVYRFCAAFFALIVLFALWRSRAEARSA